MLGMNASVSIDDLSKERFVLIVPTVACIGVLMVVGLIGNIFVVTVFGFRMKKRSTYRYLILTLAMYDLTACTIGMPGLLVELSRPFFFYSGIWCKILRYGFHVIAAGSSLTHALVAIDRYRRICRATGKQISPINAKMFCMITFILALIAALPVFIMYDSVIVETKVNNISGHICDISTDYVNTPFPVVFNGLLSFFIVITIVVMVILYSFIGHRLCVRHRFVMPLDDASQRQAPSGRLKISYGNTLKPTNGPSHFPDKNIENISVINSTPDVAKVPETISSLRAHEKKHSRGMVSRKMTITTFAIMVVFVVSFVPLEVLELETLFRKNMENELTNTQLVFYHLGYHTYIINNVANPLVYIFMDIEFRRQCTNILSLTKCKKMKTTE